LSVVRDYVVTTFALAPPHILVRRDARRDSSTKPIITGAMADKEIKEGDEVSWQWSGGRPGGVASEVKEQGEITMETKRGNEVKKNAEPDNPAVKVDREGHDVVKKASELEVEEEGPNHKEDGEKQDDKDEQDKDEKKEEEEKKDEDKKDEDKNEVDGEEKKDSEEPQAGEKRKADDDEEKKDESEPKKAKKDEAEPKENGEKPAPKKKGRPAKNGGAAKETKKKEPKRAATESGQPRRSGRNASK